MRALTDFIDDWRGAWLSLLCAIGVLLAFSQAWQAPLFGYSTDQASSGALIRFFYYPFYLAGVIVALLSWKRMLDATWRTPIMLSLLVLCAASYFWSNNPGDTLRRFIAVGMTMLCAYGLATRFSWRRLSEVMALAFTVMAVASIVMAILPPRWGIMTESFPGAWRGVWIEKNNLGANMALGFTAAATAALLNPTRKWLWAVAAAVMLILVLLSTSKTALVSVILGVGGIAFVFLSRRGPILGIVLIWLAVTVLLLLGAFVLFFPDQIFLLLGKDPTLTGRTYIWEGIAHVMETRPLLGYGYAAVWTDESEFAPLAKITQVAGFRAYHAHSCWYEVWLALGLVGLIVWGLVFAEIWIKALYSTYRGDAGMFALPFLGIYTLSSLTESMALNWNDLRWCLFVMVLVKVSLPTDEDADARF
ncbi:O-Antigen Polymerase family protein [Asticcacaulis biprosthecium C19]|uniref:O-Antigen Polymerase family protein n=1 Tax=Asticcacaulis biprosthecium C19 TaxID=715226 RepID=F4QSX0_9CAUL|nr:O-antigen ligase [Asticcacaulis biprosthecium]EGF89840.1 O-Antigen Polymerase family protein [Asticcacaulis biprosthecium C19]